MEMENVSRIKEKMWIPEPGEYVHHQSLPDTYRVVDLGYDDHYLLPDTCMLVEEGHYQAFAAFLKALPDEQSFVDSATRPYVRSDRVIGPALTTPIFYEDPVSGKTTHIGFDDYPVICLTENEAHYESGAEDWTVEDQEYADCPGNSDSHEEGEG